MKFKSIPVISEKDKKDFDVNHNLFKAGRLEFMDSIKESEISNLDSTTIFDFLEKSPGYFKDEIERLYRDDSYRDHYDKPDVYIAMVKWFYNFRHRYKRIKGLWM